MSDDEDIYSDLATINYCEPAPKKVEEENTCLKKLLEERERELVEVRERNNTLEREKKTLEENISSLYKTAVNELKKKEAVIDELTRQKDSILFRREKRKIADTETLLNKEAYGNIKYDQLSSFSNKLDIVPAHRESVPETSCEGEKLIGNFSNDIECVSRKQLIKTNVVYEKSACSSSSSNQLDSRDKFSKNSVPEGSNSGKSRYSDSTSEEKYPHNVSHQKKSNSNRFRSPPRAHRPSRSYGESIKEDKSNDYSRYHTSSRENRRRQRYDVGKTHRERYHTHSDRSPSPKRFRRDSNISEERYFSSNKKHNVKQSESIRLAAQLKSKYSKAARERSVSRTPVKKSIEAEVSSGLHSGLKKSKKYSGTSIKPILGASLIQEDLRTKRRSNSPPHKPRMDLIDVNDILKCVQSKLKDNGGNLRDMKKAECNTEKSLHSNQIKSSENDKTRRDNDCLVDTFRKDDHKQSSSKSQDVSSQSENRSFQNIEKILQNVNTHNESSDSQFPDGADCESHTPPMTPFVLQKQMPVSKSIGFEDVQDVEKCTVTKVGVNVLCNIQVSNYSGDTMNLSMKSMNVSHLEKENDRSVQDGSSKNTVGVRTQPSEKVLEKESYTPPSTPPGKIPNDSCVSSENQEECSKTVEISSQTETNNHFVFSNSQPSNASENGNHESVNVISKSKRHEKSQFSKVLVRGIATENDVEDKRGLLAAGAFGSTLELPPYKQVISTDLGHQSKLLGNSSSSSTPSVRLSKNGCKEKVLLSKASLDNTMKSMCASFPVVQPNTSVSYKSKKFISNNNVVEGSFNDDKLTLKEKEIKNNETSVPSNLLGGSQEDQSKISSTLNKESSKSNKKNEDNDQSSILYSLLTDNDISTAPVKFTPSFDSHTIVSTPVRNSTVSSISPSSVVKDHKFSYSVSNEQCEFQRPKRKRSVRLSGGSVNQSCSPGTESDNSKNIQNLKNIIGDSSSKSDILTCMGSSQNIFAVNNTDISTRIMPNSLQNIPGQSMVENSGSERNATTELALTKSVEGQSSSLHENIVVKKTVQNVHNSLIQFHVAKKKINDTSHKNNTSLTNVCGSNVINNETVYETIPKAKKISLEKYRRKKKFENANKDKNKESDRKKTLGSLSGDILENVINSGIHSPAKVIPCLDLDDLKSKNKLSANSICVSGDKNVCLMKSDSVSDVAVIKSVVNTKSSVNSVHLQKLQVKSSPNKKKNLDTICDELKANLEKKNDNVDTGTSKSVMDELHNSKVDSERSEQNKSVTENVLLKSFCEKDINKTLVNVDSTEPVESGNESSKPTTSQRIIISKFRRRAGNFEDSPTHVFSQVKNNTK